MEGKSLPRGNANCIFVQYREFQKLHNHSAKHAELEYRKEILASYDFSNFFLIHQQGFLKYFDIFCFVNEIGMRSKGEIQGSVSEFPQKQSRNIRNSCTRRRIWPFANRAKFEP